MYKINVNNKNSNQNYKNRNILIEPFDGIRKNNSRQIFKILLIIIIADCLMDCLM